MNESNFTTMKVYSIQHAEVVVLLTVGGLSVLGNIFVIILALKYTVWRNLHHLIINMAVADTLVALIKLCIGTILLFNYNFWEHLSKVQGDILCKTLPFLIDVLIHESLVTLLIISIERFRVTRLTVQRTRPYTLKQRVAIVACSWLIPMVLVSYNLFSRKLYKNHRRLICEHYRGYAYMWLRIQNSLVMLLFCVIFTLSMLILRRVSKTQAIQVNLPEPLRQARAKQRSSAMKMVLCSLLLFICCYFPHFVINTFFQGYQPEVMAGYRVHLVVYLISFFLPVVNSCFSPCIYIVFLPDCREAAKRFVRRNIRLANRRNRVQPQPNHSLELHVIRPENNNGAQTTRM